MCFEIFQAASGLARCVAGVLCCLFCGGPVLIIVGIVLLVSPNNRSGDVAQFNSAVTSYNKADAPILASTSMEVLSLPLTRTQQSITVQGDTNGVDSATHYVFSRSDNTFGGATEWPVSIQTPSVNKTLTWDIAWMKTVSKDLMCDSTHCTNDCSDNGNFQCSSGAMRSYCQTQFLGTYTDNSGSCYNGDVCGSCLYSGTLSRACVVIALDSDSVSKSSQYASCYYPFSEYDYSPSSGALTFEVMTENDPFIALQRLTDGSNDFGVTAAQQRAGGVVCLILGIALTVGIGIAGYCLFRRHQHAHHKTQTTAPPQVVVAHHVDGPVYTGQPVYEQQTQQPPASYPPQGYPAPQGYHQGYAPQAYQGGYPMHQFPPPPQYSPATADRPPQYGKPL